MRSFVAPSIALAFLFSLGCPPAPSYGGSGGRVTTGDPDFAGVASFAPGDRVRCNWKAGGTTYDGTVSAIADGRLFVDYDDGDKEAITPSLCQKLSFAAQPEGPAPVADAQTGLTGSWKITSSSNPGGGGAYSGNVSILRSGDVYQLSWSIANTPPFAGVGVDMGNLLSVGWSQAGGSFGVVAYRVNGGTLDGVWAMGGQTGPLGVEKLSGPAGLSGAYTITEGRTPTGGSYSGTVYITPTGQTYRLQWVLPSESYMGIGILRNGVLSVGWGPSNVGVVVYAVQNGMLDGTWATLHGTALGTEVLGR